MFEPDWLGPFRFVFCFNRSSLGSQPTSDSQIYKGSSTLSPHGCVPYPPSHRCPNASAFPPRRRCAVHRHRPGCRHLWKECSPRFGTGASFRPLTMLSWAVLINLSRFSSTGTTQPSRSRTPRPPNAMPCTSHGVEEMLQGTQSRHDAHNSPIDPFSRSNPIAPYKLLIATSYVVPASRH